MVRRALPCSFVGVVVCCSCSAIYRVDPSGPPAPDAAELDAARADGARADAAPLSRAPVQTLGSDAAVAPSLSASFSGVTHAGDLLVLFGGTNATSLKSVNGAGGWQRLARSGLNANIELWIAVADGSPGPITIERASGSAADGEIWMSVSEWAGWAGSPADARASGASSDTIDPGSVTASGTPSLALYGFSTGSTATIQDLPLPWAALEPIDGPGVVQRTFFEIVAAPGPVGATDAIGSAEWDAAIVAFAPSTR